MIVRVALPIPVARTFDYVWNDDQPGSAVLGRRVRVRFSGKDLWGVAVEARDASSPGGSDLEPILEVASGPFFPPDLLGYCESICEDVCAPLGILLHRTLPRVSRRGPEPRRLALGRDLSETLSYVQRNARRAPRRAEALRQLLASSGPVAESTLALPRTSVDRLLDAGILRIADETVPLSAPWPVRFPRRGVVLFVGEDRMETYAELLAAAVSDEQQVLLLVPEILLAQRTYSRLAGRIPGGALYHSRLSDGTRGRTWERVADRSIVWVVGTRSAVFLPFRSLTLIIVDEEQDPSHKQSDMLPYFHARRAARMRGGNALVVLGSAAPSLETAHAAARGEIVSVCGTPPSLRRRWDLVVPESPSRPLTPALLSDMGRVLDEGKRIVVGVPRRGYFPVVVCRACRRAVRCETCGTNLSVAERGRGAVCPICGRAPTSPRCGHCASTDVAFVGWGSLRVEEELRASFPRATILRIDADRLASRFDDGLLDELEEKADIVLGTPMMAKGPPLARVGLVVALDVDRRLALPDFRARERTLQYLACLAALTADGKVVVSTQSPDRSVFRYARSADYEGFLRSELADREAFFYPPFSHLARVTVTRSEAARRRADVLRIRRELDGTAVQVLGPVPQQRDGRRAVFLLKAGDRDVLRTACERILALRLPTIVDLDPQ